MTLHRAHNFSAGPAALPLPALELAQRELLDFGGTGMSIMEMSHRGKEYEAVHAETISLITELVGVPDTHQVLFMQGGASQQFATIPMSFLKPGKTAAYLVTGAWGEKALEEAKIVGQATAVLSTIDAGTYRRGPSAGELAVPADAAYFHYTSNETVHGVQLDATPPATPDGVPIICDMSSDFLGRPIDVSKFDLIYAGAQKNVGPSGIVIVIAKKTFVEQGRKDIPKFFRYSTHAANNSLYNTVPTLSVYLARNVLRWLKDQGGVAAISAVNRTKADTLYAALSSRPDVYSLPVEPAFRSTMNVVWRMANEEREDAFLREAKKRDMVGLKGHRSVGGMRASIYNAVPLSSVEALATLVREHATQGLSRDEHDLETLVANAVLRHLHVDDGSRRPREDDLDLRRTFAEQDLLDRLAPFGVAIGCRPRTRIVCGVNDRDEWHALVCSGDLTER